MKLGVKQAHRWSKEHRQDEDMYLEEALPTAFWQRLHQHPFITIDNAGQGAPLDFRVKFHQRTVASFTINAAFSRTARTVAARRERTEATDCRVNPLPTTQNTLKIQTTYHQ